MATDAFALTSLGGVFLSVDDAFCDIIQRERRDVPGRTIIDMTIAPDRAANVASLTRLRLTGEPFVIKKHYLGSDRRAIRVENTVSILTEANRRPRLVASVRRSPYAATPSPAGLLAVARALAGEQMLRTARWHDCLVSGSFWSVIVHAYILEAEGHAVGVDDIMSRASLPRRQAMELIRRLIDRDVFEPESGASDARYCVRLTKGFVTELESHFGGLLG